MAARWMLGGTALEGAARRDGDSIRIDTGSVSHTWGFEFVAEGEAILHDGERRHRVAWARDGETLWVHHEGRVWILKAHVEGRRDSEVEMRDSLVAPMTGTLLAIEAKAGDSVEKDQVLGVIEAMKMQCDLKAPRSGRVAEVLYRAGDQVPGGGVIVALEPEAAEEAGA